MKKLLLFGLALLAFATGRAQDKLWEKARETDASALPKWERTTNPSAFHLFHLNVSTLKTVLQQAPLRGSGHQSMVVLPFPDGDGTIKHFTIYQAPVISPGLAVKYPGIQSYIGQGVENPSSSIRFSVTLFGLHSMALTAGHGTWYIDPYTKSGDYYMVYKRAGLQAPRPFKCLTQNIPSAPGDTPPADSHARRGVNDNGNFRTYRLAIVTTVEYSQFHIAAAGLEAGTPEQKINAVLSAIAVTMTRVNSMYERDLSVSLQLIENNDLLVHIDSDELNNDDAGALLNEGHALMMEVIGAENFDMGHSFGTGGGGLAAGAPCTDFKGGAMTGIGSPVGDPFDIDYVAHEMGHQFGAGHTFNAECGGNRSDELAFETGGGTTILAYAGVCDPVVQWSSDAQFHTISIQQMRERINSISNCVPLVSSGNTPPLANAGNDYVIPIGTPFILEGTATDVDGDALTYMWDQMNNEITEQPPVPNATGGPNFRPMPISDSPNRFIPRIEDVLSNNLFPTWEVIPTVSRPLDFAVTVRDNNINGGESHTDFMHIDVTQQAGPFMVTSPNAPVNWQAATNQNVTWNVAGTTANGVNTPYVDIYMSNDGGFTYPVLLASMVPNDGSETIIVPSLTALTRIMVRGHNNIFYDISNSYITVIPAATTFTAAVNGSQNIAACRGSQVTYTLNYTNLNGFGGITTFSASGNPEGTVVTFSPATMSADGQVEVTVSTTNGSPVGLHTIIVTMTSGTTVKTIPLYLNLLNSEFAEPLLTSPVANLNGTPLNVTLDWEDDANATVYTVQVATDEDFTAIAFQSVVAESNFDLAGLSEGTTYYWRIMPANEGCTGTFSAASSFTTGLSFCHDFVASDVPVTIPADVEATVNSLLNVDEDYIIQDANVTLNITHTWITDITVKLISPAGTEVILFSEICGDLDDANATFDDNGAELVCGGSAPVISGVVMPETALSILNGENANGLWRLEVFDTEPWDGGTINSWTLNLCGVQPMLRVNVINQTSSFSVYPNPSKGTFTVKMDVVGSGPAAIDVYDMRGRRIFSKTAIVQGTALEQNISLNAEPGVYIVNVEQDGKRNSKRIILE